MHNATVIIVDNGHAMYPWEEDMLIAQQMNWKENTDVR